MKKCDISGKSLQVDRKKVSGSSLKFTLTKGKTAQIKATETSADKNKTIRYYRALSYERSNNKVATVTKNGKIKVVGKGTCKIYVYAQNGEYKTITVTVK